MTSYSPDTVVREEVRNRFEYHNLKKGQAGRLTDLREHLGLVAQILLDETPTSREQSIALTKLEEAGLWAHEAILRNE